MTLAPGRARLATSPVPSGSETAAKTIGITLVACLAASDACVTAVTMTSTSSRTSLRKSAEPVELTFREPFPDYDVLSIEMANLAACAGTPHRGASPRGRQIPDARDFSDCCAPAASGQAAAEPAMTLMNSRPSLPPPERRRVIVSV